jgi:hypothetical protein
MSTVLNFAYGSNMLWRRIAERVPSARPVERAVLHGYALHWHKVGRDGSAKCDIVRSQLPGAAVHGVVYELSAAHKHLLDEAEGLGRGYDEQEVRVERPSAVVSAWTYVATSKDPSLLPFSWYKALVIAGAREHGLPVGYVQGLLSVPATEDPDAARSSLHWALANGDRR